MNNLETVINVLAAHREARQWSDEAVAIDMLAQLGLDQQDDAPDAKPVDVTPAAAPTVPAGEAVGGAVGVHPAAGLAEATAANAESERAAAETAARGDAGLSEDTTTEAQARVEAAAARTQSNTGPSPYDDEANKARSKVEQDLRDKGEEPAPPVVSEQTVSDLGVQGHSVGEEPPHYDHNDEHQP